MGTVSAHREKWAANAERKGWLPGMSVEAPLLGGDGVYTNSSYVGTLRIFGPDDALVDFRRGEGMERLPKLRPLPSSALMSA